MVAGAFNFMRINYNCETVTMNIRGMAAGWDLGFTFYVMIFRRRRIRGTDPPSQI